MQIYPIHPSHIWRNLAEWVVDPQAGVAELVDAAALKFAVRQGLRGSSPLIRTTNNQT